MYKVVKRLEISAAHKLNLNYISKCETLHGHNWIIYIYLKSKDLNANGMVYDFTKIKELISNKLDHKNLNDILKDNPTAENIARWIADEIGPKCYKVSVQESEGNIAIYERD
ncbi:6-pyruvoyl trahydropterin synthase family protein [Megamonas funiformis]|uniref:6-pyruvoyl trahydropterin synthase family protein n=1 Tax=Megamonas funiformis TaxID=437897 RepID=UPI003FF04300